ncbi:MAG: 50S ribosomal protein L30 [Chloroflexota bacterium]|nr:50S ribosomal protein L30 [Chloroflexota bacterium]
MAKEKNFIKITLVKSPIGQNKRQRGTLRALGLRRINHTVEKKNNPVIRGMINKVSHLVRIEE